MNKNVWEQYPQIWKTQATFFSWLRGGIRRSLWARSPIKLEFLKKHRFKIPNPSPRGKLKQVWGGCCAICNNTFPLKEIEVDHKRGNISLNNIEDIQLFIESIVLVSEQDLQLVCKSCHKAKSHAEKQGISFEEALIEKEIIAIIKVKGDKAWLESRGIVPASNAAKRREQIKLKMQEERESVGREKEVR